MEEHEKLTDLEKDFKKHYDLYKETNEVTEELKTATENVTAAYELENA
jgi:hypothetical protein